MENKKRLDRRLLAFLVLFILSLLIGCTNSPTEPADEPSTDQEAMMKLAEEDSSLTSFEPNYNEEEAMDYFLELRGEAGLEIQPLRVGHRMRLVNRNLDITTVGDTAYGKMTLTFEGVLFIAAAFNVGATVPDTMIQKPFTSVVTRNIIYVKIGNSNRPMRNWVIAAISLPQGGTADDNIQIQKLTITSRNNGSLEITSPNDFYFRRGPGWWRQFPTLPRHDSVKVDIELFSKYEANDFVTITFGANKNINLKAKRRFAFVSSTPSGDGYLKVYSQTFHTHQSAGFFHAIVNAYPKQVIFESSASVEHDMWGIPYIVSR
jgi:hypothetical protein